jgi:hypothetical protein
MTREQLGEELKRRQRATVPGMKEFSRVERRGILSAIERMTCDEMIDSYLTCSCCGRRQVADGQELDRVIAAAQSADDFLSSVDRIKKPVH